MIPTDVQEFVAREFAASEKDEVLALLEAGTESFPATMTLEVAGLRLKVKFEGEIRLQ